MTDPKVKNKPTRLLFTNFTRVGTFSDGRPRLDIYFKSNKGIEYVWSPDLHGETLKMFQIAGQAIADHNPKESEDVNQKLTTEYTALAIKVAKGVYQKTSLNRVESVAKALFKFEMAPPIHITMPDMVAQEIFNWAITLGVQPIDENEKLKLLRKFFISLAPVRNSAAMLADS